MLSICIKLFLGQVLCFSAMWDDTEHLHGETRPVTIHYYLVDDTVEVREVHKPNCGRDPFAVLMRRQRLPKKFKPEAGEMQRGATSE